MYEMAGTYLTIRVAQDVSGLDFLLHELEAGYKAQGSLVPILKRHSEQDPTSKFVDIGM